MTKIKIPTGSWHLAGGREAKVSKCPSILGDDECGRKTKGREKQGLFGMLEMD